MKIYLFVFVVLLLQCFTAFAQSNNIIIGNNEKLVVKAKDSFKYIIGNPAIITHGTTIFKADSIYISDKSPRYLEAFSHVYINENDSVITTASYLKYYIDAKTATLKNNVTIKTKSGTFNTNEVDYNLNTKLATYTKGGNIISKQSNLTSKGGQYYANTKDALFTGDVKLIGTDFTVDTDTLYYNVNTELASFVSYTKMYNKKKGQLIETFRGTYDMKNGVSNFTERTVIKDKNTTIVADKVDRNEKLKTAKLQGRASIIRKDDAGKTEIYRGEIIDLDEKNERYHIEGNGLYSSEKENFVITGNYLDGDGKEGKFLARGKPVAIIKQENDSIFIAADTLYSGRYINNKKVKTDTLLTAKVLSLDTTLPINDTTRFFEAFHNVKVFSDSVQAVCDSLYYTEIDSVFRLYQNPIVWNDKNQITGDTMYLFTKNKKIEKAKIFESAFVLNTVLENKYYNQIKANFITTYFKNGEIDSLYNKGSAQIVFYLQDDAKAYIGVDKSSADIIIANFENKEIFKIKWINKYDATTTPMKELNLEDAKLRGFNTQQNRRPKSKFELFF